MIELLECDQLDVTIARGAFSLTGGTLTDRSGDVVATLRDAAGPVRRVFRMLNSIAAGVPDTWTVEDRDGNRVLVVERHPRLSGPRPEVRLPDGAVVGRVEPGARPELLSLVDRSGTAHGEIVRITGEGSSVSVTHRVRDADATEVGSIELRPTPPSGGQPVRRIRFDPAAGVAVRALTIGYVACL